MIWNWWNIHFEVRPMFLIKQWYIPTEPHQGWFQDGSRFGFFFFWLRCQRCRKRKDDEEFLRWNRPLQEVSAMLPDWYHIPLHLLDLHVSYCLPWSLCLWTPRRMCKLCEFFSELVLWPSPFPLNVINQGPGSTPVALLLLCWVILPSLIPSSEFWLSLKLEQISASCCWMVRRGVSKRGSPEGWNFPHWQEFGDSWKERGEYSKVIFDNWKYCQCFMNYRKMYSVMNWSCCNNLF